MSQELGGLHHVTAITGDAQKNVDFYAGLLGMRFVKRTVNFDDPGSYHLYYGDALGRPGTALTFFAWPGAAPGVGGTGEPSAVAFAVPEGSWDFWRRRLEAAGVGAAEPQTRFDESVLAFTDPDGMEVELVARPGAALRDPWGDGPIPAEHAIRGFDGVTLRLRELDRSKNWLQGPMGFDAAGESEGRVRYASGAGAARSNIDLRVEPGRSRGRTGGGTIHHIAFRTPDDAGQKYWLDSLTDSGGNVTDVQERFYFRSIYFREPGGVLYEIATDGPGFTADESPETLGTKLTLPPWYEPLRPELEKRLTPLRIPQAERAAGNETSTARDADSATTTPVPSTAKGA